MGVIRCVVVVGPEVVIDCFAHTLAPVASIRGEIRDYMRRTGLIVFSTQFVFFFRHTGHLCNITRCRTVLNQKITVMQAIIKQYSKQMFAFMLETPGFD